MFLLFLLYNVLMKNIDIHQFDFENLQFKEYGKVEATDYNRRVYYLLKDYQKKNNFSNTQLATKFNEVLKNLYDNLKGDRTKSGFKVFKAQYGYDSKKLNNMWNKEGTPSKKLDLKDLYCICNILDKNPDDLLFGINPHLAPFYYKHQNNSKLINNLLEIFDKEIIDTLSFNINISSINFYLNYILDNYDIIVENEYDDTNIDIMQIIDIIKCNGKIDSLFSKSLANSLSIYHDFKDRLHSFVDLDIRDFPQKCNYMVFDNKYVKQEFYNLKKITIESQMELIHDIYRSNSKIGELCNCSRTTINRVAKSMYFNSNSQYFPNVDLLINIALAGNMSITELLFKKRIDDKIGMDKINYFNPNNVYLGCDFFGYKKAINDDDFLSTFTLFFSNDLFPKLINSTMIYYSIIIYFIFLLTDYYNQYHIEEITYPFSDEEFAYIEEKIGTESLMRNYYNESCKLLLNLLEYEISSTLFKIIVSTHKEISLHRNKK